MTPPPEITVVVAVYNQDRYLATLLSALAQQDVPVAYEVVVCDDGSTDATADLIRRCRGLDLRHIWQPNQGFRVSRSRNNGIRCARGDLLVFVDGDTIPRPFFLRDHWEAHRQPGRLVCGDLQNIVTGPDPLPPDARVFLADWPDLDQGADRPDRQAWIDSDRPWMACTSSNMSVARAHVVPFDERFQGWGSEDRDFAYRVFSAGLEVVLLERSGLTHLWQQREPVAWNPAKGGSPEAVVAALRSKLFLYRKYPGDVMAPSLDLVRYCWHDRRSDTWRIGAAQHDVSVATLLADFEHWLTARDGVS